MSWLHDKTTELLPRVQQAKQLKVFPYFRPMQNVGPRVRIGDKSCLNYASNDYLGLSQSRALIDRAIEGTRQYGTGLGSARPQATSIRHEVLEQRLARWLGYPACAVFTTGYQAIVGTLQTFLDDDTTVVLDKLSHASIMDGALLAQGQHPDLEMRFFKHNDVAHLDKTLAGAVHAKRLVVVEGLYSVDGDLAPLPDILTVCRKHGAVIMLDDAHGLGALGPTGRGVMEMNNLTREIDLLIGTFSKSFGTVGGFVCADAALIEYLKLSARSFVFSASLPLAQVEAALAALDIIELDHALVHKLQDNGTFFREALLSLGFDIGQSSTHITPIFLNDEELTMKFGAYLYHGASIQMMPFVAPGVPKGKERLRCNVTAAHTEADMGYTLEALTEIGKMLGVLPASTQTGSSFAQRTYWFLTHELRGTRNAGLPFLKNEMVELGKKAVEKFTGKKSNPG
jgi:8-amino-7-oxononanoate synthase